MHALGQVLLLLLAVCACGAHAAAPAAPGSSPDGAHMRLRAHQQHQNVHRSPHNSALEDVLSEYVERHRRCLADPENGGRYVVASMDDAWAGQTPTTFTILI